MSAPLTPTGPMPRLLRATYLAGSERLLRETRATKLYYFPGPVFFLIVFGILDYAAASAKYGWSVHVPYLTDGLRNLPTSAVDLPFYALLVFLLITLILLVWLIVRYLRWVSTVYAITTHRVIVQSGIVGREFDQIPIPQVRGVDVRQSAGQRLLGYGTVRVSSESGTSSIGNEDWEGVPKPFEFQKLVEAANQGFSRPPGT